MRPGTGLADCPGQGVDDLCAYAQGLDPYEDGCGLCTLGMNQAVAQQEPLRQHDADGNVVWEGWPPDA